MLVMLIFLSLLRPTVQFYPRFVGGVPRRALSYSAPLYSTSSDSDVHTSSNIPTINWFPGHISSASKQLSQTLKSTDIVIEVRDGRIPLATSHPSVLEWTGGKPRIVVVTRPDCIPFSARKQWESFWKTLKLGGAGKDEFGVERVEDKSVLNMIKQVSEQREKYTTRGTAAAGNEKKNENKNKNRNSSENDIDDTYTPLHFLYLNAKQGGKSLIQLKKMISAECSHVTSRRQARGLEPRPLRVGVIGYPNVGKSATINRILGRKRVKSADTPGVTRSLQWVKVKSDNRSDKTFELLDSPGIIEADLIDQRAAMLLAACNSIGPKAYDNQRVCSFLLDWIIALHKGGWDRLYFPDFEACAKKRWDVDVFGAESNDSEEAKFYEGEMPTGEEILHAVAYQTCRGDLENASLKILQDFRSQRLGEGCLQVAPKQRQKGDNSERGGTASDARGTTEEKARFVDKEDENVREAKKLEALKELKKKNIALPETGDGDEDGVDGLIGKGKFDGW